MSDKEILRIFYQEIVTSINQDNQVTIDNAIYQFPFYIGEGKSEELPVLMINKKEEFDLLLVEYIRKYLDLYDSIEDFIQAGYLCCQSRKIEDIIKYLLSSVWLNMTEEDFLNPIGFFKRRILFLDNYSNLKEMKINASLDKEANYMIESSVKTQIPSLESPYCFYSSIYLDEENRKDEFILPKISFGIDNNKAYIYSIQTINYTNRELSSFDKKINRYLYKANQGVNDSEEYMDYKNGESSYYPENISDITVSSLYSLTLFFKMLEYLGIQEVECIPFLPLRYLSKTKSYEKTNQLISNLYKELHVDFSKDNHSMEEYDLAHKNIVDKFIRTFNRFIYHFPEYQITSYPYEVGSSLIIKNSGKRKEADNILNQIMNVSEVEIKKERSR